MSGQEVISENLLLTEWHWSLELLFYFVPILIGILSTAPQSILVRNDFAMRIVLSIPASLFIFFVVLHEIPKIADIAVFSLAFSFLFCFLLGRWCTLRLNHIGWSRWLVLLLLVPLVNLVWLIALFFIPGRKPVSQEANAAP